MKLMILEPNLRNSCGHCYEAMKTISYSIRKFNEIESYFLVSHKNITTEVLLEFDRMYPLAKVSCFESQDNNIAYKYIHELIKKFCLSKNDLVTITTAHLNELCAVAKLSHEVDSPNFLMQIHQFFPPLADSNLVKLNRKIEKTISTEFKKTFSLINWQKVVVGTTPVQELNNKLSLLAERKIVTLPVPFPVPESNKKKLSNKNEIKIGFFGDNRKEKGLLPFLRYLKKESLLQEVKYIINFQSPRCYTVSEFREIDDIVKNLQKNPNITIIRNPLSSIEYRSFLNSCDFIILPYDPKHYNIRMSGIAIECGISGIPILTSESTSIANLIHRKKLAGEVFVFSDEQSKFNINLYKSIKKIKKDIGGYGEKAQLLKNFYRKEYSAENFIENYVLKFNKFLKCQI